jgi:hypothetical protein
MTRGSGDARYLVRLTVPRRGGWRAWGAVRGTFEHRLTEQASDVVLAPRIDRELRCGRDYVRVAVVATVVAGNVAEALDRAWWAFSEATGDDRAGWDMTAAAAEIQPADT